VVLKEANPHERSVKDKGVPQSSCGVERRHIGGEILERTSDGEHRLPFIQVGVGRFRACMGGSVGRRKERK
jgi:hypothetical protein